MEETKNYGKMRSFWFFQTMAIIVAADWLFLTSLYLRAENISVFFISLAINILLVLILAARAWGLSKIFSDLRKDRDSCNTETAVKFL